MDSSNLGPVTAIHIGFDRFAMGTGPHDTELRRRQGHHFPRLHKRRRGIRLRIFSDRSKRLHYRTRQCFRLQGQHCFPFNFYFTQLHQQIESTL